MPSLEHIPDQIAENLDENRRTPAFQVENLKKKSPSPEKSSGRGWKSYTSRFVNLTAGIECARMHACGNRDGRQALATADSIARGRVRWLELTRRLDLVAIDTPAPRSCGRHHAQRS